MRSPALPHTQPTTLELFTPKLVTVFREGYGLADLRADAIAGLTVAIVALPLSMAIAIASGVGPEGGLFTAIVGGFLVSLLGGSRVQIGGPAGAFIVLVAAIVQRHGYDGLVLATIIAGLIMAAVGFLRLGTYIKYIPYPVTAGFTAGIAVIILASQLKDLFGLELAHEPAEFIPKLIALWNSAGTVHPAAIAVTLLSVALIVILRRLRPHWPGFLIIVVLAAAATSLFGLDIATIGSRFGGIPSMLPSPSLPAFTLQKLQDVLPDALALALLGAIESLLSAVVADGLTGRRHRSNCELVAQGAANIGSAIFGGICVTGTIARTATNIRAGARGPMSGIFHSVYILLFMLVAAPLVSYVPLAALGAVLAVVAWNMAEKDELIALMRSSRGDAFVLLATFLLTVFVDLPTAIAVGVVAGSFLFLHRMAETVEVEGGTLATEDQADNGDDAVTAAGVQKDGVFVFRISGAFFFGATARVSTILDRIGERPRVFILDFSAVPLIDSTAAKALHGFVHKLQRSGTQVYFSGARPAVRHTLVASGLREPEVTYAESVESARAAAVNVPSPLVGEGS
ncbi:MAG: sulfate permease, SulP family [Hyphomicrobiales bacterium]|nr:sulfate permease, SulP family [Hyphomicrobiales bacterium]